jgi:hypothetical protein
MNDLDPIGTPKIWKPESRVRKPQGGDIKRSNLCGDQVTHFANCTKIPYVENSSCNHKKIGTTFDAGFTICVSSSNEGKKKVR